MKKQKKTVKTVLVIVVALVLIATAVGVLVTLFPNGDTPIKPSETPTPTDVVLTVGTNDYSPGSKIPLTSGANYISVNVPDYAVCVTIAENVASFDYIADERYYSFPGNDDMSAVFPIVKDEKGFSVNIPTNMKVLLSKLRETENVELPNDVNFKAVYFVIKITLNEKDYLFEMSVDMTEYLINITLDTSELLF